MSRDIHSRVIKRVGGVVLPSPDSFRKEPRMLVRAVIAWEVVPFNFIDLDTVQLHLNDYKDHLMSEDLASKLARVISLPVNGIDTDVIVEVSV